LTTHERDYECPAAAHGSDTDVVVAVKVRLRDVFLAAGVPHSLLGCRTHLLELHPSLCLNRPNGEGQLEAGKFFCRVAGSRKVDVKALVVTDRITLEKWVEPSDQIVDATINLNGGTEAISDVLPVRPRREVRVPGDGRQVRPHGSNEHLTVVSDAPNAVNQVIRRHPFCHPDIVADGSDSGVVITTLR